MGGVVTSGGRSRRVVSSLPERRPDGCYRHFRREVPMDVIVTSGERSRWMVSALPEGGPDGWYRLGAGRCGVT